MSPALPASSSVRRSCVARLAPVRGEPAAEVDRGAAETLRPGPPRTRLSHALRFSAAVQERLPRRARVVVLGTAGRRASRGRPGASSRCCGRSTDAGFAIEARPRRRANALARAGAHAGVRAARGTALLAVAESRTAAAIAIVGRGPANQLYSQTFAWDYKSAVGHGQRATAAALLRVFAHLAPGVQHGIADVAANHGHAGRYRRDVRQPSRICGR